MLPQIRLQNLSRNSYRFFNNLVPEQAFWKAKNHLAVFLKLMLLKMGLLSFHPLAEHSVCKSLKKIEYLFLRSFFNTAFRVVLRNKTDKNESWQEADVTSICGPEKTAKAQSAAVDF